MAALMACMTFVNTILDNLKDTLIFTLAEGGGAHVVPWLTVYGVLPCSILFLSIFGKLSGTMSREKLFTRIISAFLLYILVFAVLLFPNTHLLHPHAAAERWLLALPAGFSGGVAVVRNWSFSLFYCASELWGDVCLSLLFWGLANETTSMQDAPILYPLFGIGANIAQVFAGQALKLLGAKSGGAAGAFQSEMMSLSAVVLVFGTLILALHNFIASPAFAAPRAAAPPPPAPPPPSLPAASSPRAGQAPPTWPDDGVRGRQGRSATFWTPRRVPPSAGAGSAPQIRLSLDSGEGGNKGVGSVQKDAGSRAGSGSPVVGSGHEGGKNGLGMSFTGAIRYCWQSPSIRCLATMAIAQGLCTNLLEYAWKTNLQAYCPDSHSFTAFMGDVASWAGVTTVGLTLLAPTCFKLLGWRRTARATPDFLLYAGVPFFAVCVAYQVTTHMSLFLSATRPILLALSVAGAALYVLTRSAKFSLFKPAEEMVYLSLDRKARLNGKATVDVLGAQFGKSSGSLLQQALLIVTAGSAMASLPLMLAVFVYIAVTWQKSVDELSHIVASHTSLESCDFDDDEDILTIESADEAPVAGGAR